ncbi:ArsR/SmtB family transcription factor [Sphaerochaeta halotolerans]|jgi:predicted transcriptional regulator|uniref:ArsR/SmtB family transcription factor n=1 Tax=Sphaerochaeta halotolerans TaxID=2293840 RepID=UPI00136B9A4F|nr:ArsR family transcriptional regulator [Sphaerochaeta halotolerans]MXI85805.1 helix-turn-helix domain-containing protein [Sphaerochaeta halotolerans]
MLKEMLLDYSDKEKMLVVAKAIANEARINILELLNERSLSVNEIAEHLQLPTSTAALHVSILERAGLLITESQPGIRGSMKVSSRGCDRILIKLLLDQSDALKENSVVLNMPIGNFVDCDIHPTCGLVSEKSAIGIFDQPCSFYYAERTTAQLLWFYKGYVEYRFANAVANLGRPKNVDLSFEACSEAPFYRNDWPSDITVWINGKEVGTWTSPGDLGGRKGKYNPPWWPDTLNQYGLLNHWVVNSKGTYLNNERIGNVTIDDLLLRESCFISVKIGIKEHAKNIGGVSLFGEHFGDYQQNLLLKLDYVLL